MRFTKTAVAALVLSTALLVGCSQAPATNATDATQDEAAVEQAEPEAEPEPEPTMTNWQEGAFYDRPTSEIVSDLELLGFELTNEESYEDADALGDVTYYFSYFKGAPESNPVEGSDGTVQVSFTYENPALLEGETECSLETIEPSTVPTGVVIGFYLPEADSSEYETIARSVGDAVGLPAFTDSYVGDPFETGRMVGNFTYPDTFKGQETESMLIVSSSSNPELLPNPDMPLSVSYGPYVSERA